MNEHSSALCCTHDDIQRQQRRQTEPQRSQGIRKEKKKKTPRPENEASTDSVVHHTPFQDDTNIKEDGT